MCCVVTFWLAVLLGLSEALGGVHSAEQLDLGLCSPGAEEASGEAAAQVSRCRAAQTSRAVAWSRAAAEGAESTRA